MREKMIQKLKILCKNDLNIKLLILYLVLNLLYLLIGSYMYTTQKILNNFGYKDFSIGMKYLFFINLIIIIKFFYSKWCKNDRSFLKKPIFIGIILCIFFSIISLIFSYDRNISLEGCWERYEGFYSLMYYWSLMIISTFVIEKYKKFLVNVIIFCGIIQALYGICQTFSLFNVKQFFHPFLYWSDEAKAIVTMYENWITGFTTNPNFFGTYMLLCLSYTLGLFIDSQNKYENVIYVLLTILFMFSLLISNTLSVIVGLTFVFMYILIYCLKCKQYLKIITILIVIISTTYFTIKINKTTFLSDTKKTGMEITEISKGNLNNRYGSKRIYIWKETAKIVPNYLIHGVGIDCFHKAFNGEALIFQQPNKRILFDKAHNEYLQILVTQGIFELFSYLFVCLYIVCNSTEQLFIYKKIYLILPVIGYLVQAFFNISVIEVAPIFWIALGLCCTDENNKENFVTNNGKQFNMNLEVMLSVMNLKKDNLDKMNITSKCTVINQCGKEKFEKYKNFDIYSYNETGNSNSRNRGLEHISEDIILLCDDDVIYNEGYEKNIINEFKDNPQADVIIFNMHSPNRKKRVNKRRKRLHIYNSLNYASYNIAFKRESVIEKNIKFNTDFGPNAKFNNGTDTMFIVDILKSNLKMYSSPVFIGTAYNKNSTWFKGYNEKFFFNKGALFTAISRRFRCILCLQYLLRHKHVLEKYSFWQAFYIMKKGSNDYIRYINNKEKI